MAKTNTGLVEYAKAQLGLPYWYGTFGDIATKSLLNDKREQYPDFYDRSDYKQGWEHQYGQRVHDCVGLIKGYLWSANATAKPKYNRSQDVSANGMLNICKEKGTIGTMPDLAGVLVFFKGHVGIYVGDGYVIEAQGHDYGVVKTELAKRPWKNWGKCPWIKYPSTSSTTTTAKKSVTEIAREVIAGKWGIGTTRKSKLAAAGYNYAEVQAEVNKLLKGSSSKKSVTKGCKVKVNKGAKTYNGKSVASFVYNKVYTVDELKGKRAVLDKDGICTAFNTDDLTVQ